MPPAPPPGRPSKRTTPPRQGPVPREPVETWGEPPFVLVLFLFPFCSHLSSDPLSLALTRHQAILSRAENWTARSRLRKGPLWGVSVHRGSAVSAPYRLISVRT